MKRDGQTYIWIPSALTLNRVTAETAQIINAVHSMIGRPTVTAGDLNPYYFDLNDLDMGGAPFTRDAEPGLAVCGPIENLGYLPLDYVRLICTFGQVAAQVLGISAGDIEGLPVWFELTDIETPCPFAPAPVENEEPETWETWGTYGDSHKPVKLGTKWYRSNAVGASGALLNASEWVNMGLTVKTLAEYKQILAEYAPKLEEPV